ncbi:MAG: MlaD family protein [Bacteroidia bacterium]|nr:MlaD family protein [Bacteroidia bacterium]
MQSQSKFSRNFIIGVSFLIALLLLYFGVNFLKGTNVLKKQKTYTVIFENVSGLHPSSPVYVNGYQIGLVNNIKMHNPNPLQFAVDINLESDYRIPKGSYFEFGSDLLGASQVNLVVNQASGTLLSPGDTLLGRQKADMMKSAAGMLPKADSILMQVDSVVLTLHKLLSNPMWEQSITGIGSTVSQLEQSSKNINIIIASLRKDLPVVTQNLTTVSNDLKGVASELNSLELQKTFGSIDNTVENLRLLSSKLNNTDNSLGKLVNDTQLHDSLTNTIYSATKLLEDIRENPKRYLSIKLRLF